MLGALFSTLEASVERQEENYLTKTLAAVYNESPRFRAELADVLFLANSHAFARLHDWSSREHLTMVPQVGFSLGDRRGILDAIVRRPSGENVAAFEVKFAAPLGRGQLQKYWKHLGTLRRACPLVLLGLAPSADDLPHTVRADVTTVSWLALYQAASKAAQHARTNNPERWLLEAWMDFLQSKGVVPPRTLTDQDWKRLARLAELVSGTRKRGQVADDVGTALGAMQAGLTRLELHRDQSWQSLARSGWLRTSGMYREDLAESKPHARPYDIVLFAGFYHRPKRRFRRLLHSTEIGLELKFLPRPRLSIYVFRATKKQHPQHDDSAWLSEWVWTPQQTRHDFRLPFDKSHEEVAPTLDDALRWFKRSRAWREVA